MSSQWRPLQPDTMSSNGSLSPLQFGRPVSRQITKNPQNIVQNFQSQPQPQHNGFGGMNSFNNGSNNSNNASSGLSPGSMGGPGGLSSGPGGLPNSSSTSRLYSLMGNNSAFDFGLEPGFGGGGVGHGGSRNSGGGFGGGGGPPPSNSRQVF